MVYYKDMRDTDKIILSIKSILHSFGVIFAKSQHIPFTLYTFLLLKHGDIYKVCECFLNRLAQFYIPGVNLTLGKLVFILRGEIFHGFDVNSVITWSSFFIREAVIIWVSGL